MPPSAAKEAEADDGRRLAVVAEALFLANLLVAPGLAFIALFWLWRKYPEAPLLARQHLRQATIVSLWGGLLIISFTALFLVFGGLHWQWTWVLVIMYFTCIHSTLVMFGMFGLAKAMAGQVWRYPLIGPRLHNENQ